MKEFIRREILARRSRQERDKKVKKDIAIRKNLRNISEYQNSNIILFYVSIRGEVRTESLISEALENGKRVLVPFVNLANKTMLISEISDLDDLEPGSFGIPEPKNPKEFPLDEIDLVVVPGVAFDKTGNRVGFGTGFYDKFVKTLNKRIPLIALAYDFQIVKEIQPEEHDVKVHKIVTENEIIEC
ncbi:MAG: 5-formyltetrahydrofolate cyclo-ligase [Candidatus Aenigmarchaeota archaeon]|nr:5-formyltetrahydrofolate cyclo-ligase [Candidatus Aenigmarchaeota archaeon]